MKKISMRITAVLTVIALFFATDAFCGLYNEGARVYAAESVSDSDATQGIILATPKADAPKRYEALDEVASTYNAAKPAAVIDEKKQAAVQNIENIVGEEIKTATTTSINWTLGESADFLGDMGGAYRTQGLTDIKWAIKKYAEAGPLESKAGTYGEAGAEGRMRRMVAKADASYNKGMDELVIASGFDIGSVVLKTASVALDGYSIYSDIQGLKDLQNEHSSLRALEGTLLIADASLATVGILATLGVVSVGTPLFVVGVLVGLSSALVHSEGFSNWANSKYNGHFAFWDAFTEFLFPWMKTPDGVGCYKPNIYIYDEKGRQIDLVFTYPQLITISIPDYRTGWSVTADGESNLVTSDGEECTYLFYESITSRSLFDTEEGFYISADERVAEWTEILSAYGFNETEIHDFIEFWDVKLCADKDYIMYPQYTETVDIAMELVITPEPENIVRMWFVFEEYQGQIYEQEEIQPFDREGYTVVEWGGMIF